MVHVRSLCGHKAARLLLRNLCEPWWVRMAASLEKKKVTYCVRVWSVSLQARIAAVWPQPAVSQRPSEHPVNWANISILILKPVKYSILVLNIQYRY